MADIDPRLAELDIADAERGDDQAARRVIEHIRAELKNGVLSVPIQCYLLDAMRRISDGEDANAALHLKRPRKRPPETDRLIDIAIEVERLHQSGMSKGKAAAAVAERMNRGMDARNIEKAHTKYGVAARAAVAMERGGEK